MRDAWPVKKILLINLLIAAVYWLVGYIGLLLTVPPSGASPFWPAAGVALALTLQYGYRILPGILIGSYLVNLDSLLNATDGALTLKVGLVTLAIAAAVTLQAYVGRHLLKRYLQQPLALITLHDISLFMLLAGPLACLVAASISVLALTQSGIVPLDQSFLVWGTWWVGDMVGALTVTPALLAFIGKPASVWRPRRLALLLPLSIVLLLILGFFQNVYRQVEQRINSDLDVMIENTTEHIQDSFAEVEAQLDWIISYLRSSAEVTQDEFEQFTHTSLQHSTGILSYYWLTDSKTTPTLYRHADNPTPPGCQAEHSGPETFLPQINLTSSHWVFLPAAQPRCNRLLIYKHVGLVSAKRNTELLSNSLIMVAVDLHALLQDAIKYLPTEQLSIRIELPAEQNRSLYAAGQTDTFQPNPVKLELSRHADLFIQNNYLRLSFEATQNYLTEQFSWDVWSVLNGGFLVAALFSAGLLVITARHSITESIVASRTRDLKQENSQRVRTQQLLAMQSSVLEMIASDADLNRILARICVDIEKLSPQGTIASVMLVDAEGRMLNLVEAPSLAGEFRACLQNFPIGENQGSCGTAVYRGEQVVVEDISNDPLWQDHLDLAASAGLKSCWSTPFFRKDGKVLGAFALSHTTQRKPGRQDHAHMKAAAFLSSLAVEQAHAREQMNRLSLAVEQSPSAVIMTDTSGQIEYVNQKFTEITQYRADEARGRNADRLLQSDFSENDLGEIHATLFSGKEWRGSLLNRRKDGSEYWAQYYISPVRNQHNEITHIVGIHDDITETRRSHEKITYQATHDLLTGLFNRSEFERRLDILLATTSNETTQHTLCFIDLDQFKIVNDTCGHVAGDELLRQLASIMQKNIRKHDVLARVGGDEFAILFEHCELAQALETANTLRQQVAEHIFSWDDRSFNVGLSAGLVAINQHSPNRVELLREADAACYAAKDTGRNRIHIYHEDDETTARRSSEIRWARKVREALREDRFILYQQLISPLQQAQAPCFEILLRMLTPDGDIIAPDQFLPAAERYNIAPEVDAWVVERAFMLIQKSPQLLEQVEYFSINLSGLSLNTGFAGQIIDWLQQYNLPPQKICLEITETAAIGNLSHAIEFIDKLKQVGIRFALDDFGSGLSSFAYLKNLHVDVLKIDGQFVRDILSDPMDLAMVKSINEIGKVMGKTTVAEFVESEAVRNKLRELGIDYAQGYGIAEPEPCRPIQPSAQAS